jgi:hypothetical protein
MKKNRPRKIPPKWAQYSTLPRPLRKMETILSSDKEAEQDQKSSATTPKDNRSANPKSKTIGFARKMFIQKEKIKIDTSQTTKKKKWNEP